MSLSSSTILPLVTTSRSTAAPSSVPLHDSSHRHDIVMRSPTVTLHASIDTGVKSSCKSLRPPECIDQQRHGTIVRLFP